MTTTKRVNLTLQRKLPHFEQRRTNNTFVKLSVKLVQEI